MKLEATGQPVHSTPLSGLVICCVCQLVAIYAAVSSQIAHKRVEFICNLGLAVTSDCAAVRAR